MTFPLMRGLAALGLSLTLATTAAADQRSYAHTHGQAQHGGGLTGDQVAGGLLALLLLGIAIDKLDDNDRRPSGRVTINTAPDRRSHEADRPNRRVLPTQCLRRLETQNGPRRVFLERCLERNFRFVNQLPRQCETQVWTNRGWRDAFRARCLRRNGYTIGS